MATDRFSKFQNEEKNAVSLPSTATSQEWITYLKKKEKKLSKQEEMKKRENEREKRK